MFLQDKGQGLVLRWGKRNQLGMELDLLCWIPNYNKTLPGNHLKMCKRHANMSSKGIIIIISFTIIACISK